MNKIENLIGDELVKLALALEHFYSLKEYYNSIIALEGGLKHMKDLEDFDKRSISLQHFLNFTEIQQSDFEDIIIFDKSNDSEELVLRIIKREKILSTMNDLQGFQKKLKQKTKNRIIEHLQNSETEFSGIAISRFRDNLNAYFDIEIISDYSEIYIKDAFVGYSFEGKDDNVIFRYEHINELTL